MKPGDKFKQRRRNYPRTIEILWCDNDYVLYVQTGQRPALCDRREFESDMRQHWEPSYRAQEAV